MKDPLNAPLWHAFASSVRGAMHAQVGLPNQDACRWFPETGRGPPVILALSDGHGGPKYFRSDRGADFAVQAAVAVLRDLLPLAEQAGNQSLTGVRLLVAERLPRRLARVWQQRITSHLEAHPFTEEEWEWLATHTASGANARQRIEENPSIAYGATLLAVLVTELFILFVQLGDGDIMLVSDTGEVACAISQDKRFALNETSSLCAPHAWRSARIGFLPLRGAPPERSPALIMLSTDGYRNAFANEAHFHQVGSDLLDMIFTEGIEVVCRDLPMWLEEAALTGNGDDVTLGIISRYR